MSSIFQMGVGSGRGGSAFQAEDANCKGPKEDEGKRQPGAGGKGHKRGTGLYFPPM